MELCGVAPQSLFSSVSLLSVFCQFLVLLLDAAASFLIEVAVDQAPNLLTFFNLMDFCPGFGDECETASLTWASLN